MNSIGAPEKFEKWYEIQESFENFKREKGIVDTEFMILCHLMGIWGEEKEEKFEEFKGKFDEISIQFKKASFKEGRRLLQEFCCYIASETFKQTSDYEEEIKFQEYCDKKRLQQQDSVDKKKLIKDDIMKYFQHGGNL
jgi:hypothetical protein